MTNPYKLNINGVVVDCYDVQDAIGFRQSAVAHAFKKMFAMGNRSGGKSYEQDLDDCIKSLTRAKEQLNGVPSRATEDDRREGAKVQADDQRTRSENRTAGAASARLSRPSPPTEDGLEEAFAYLRELDRFIEQQKGHKTLSFPL